MVDLQELQRDVYANKVTKGFDVDDVNLEFCYLYGELAEAFEAYRKKSCERSRRTRTENISR
jgi:hypothetical protein